MMPAPSFTAEQRQRYARHLTLAEMGPVGQQRLMHSRVLIVGVGALVPPWRCTWRLPGSAPSVW